MATDDKDNDSPGDKKAPAPKQVVVTHYGKKKKQPEDVPSEIIPTEPTHIISSPVDIGSASSPSHQSAAKAPTPNPAKPFYQSHEPNKEEIPEKMSEPAFHGAASTATSQEKFSYAGSASPPGVPPYLPPESDFNSGASQGRGLFWKLLLTAAIVVVGYFTYNSTIQLHELQQQANNDQTSMLALTEQAKRSLQEMNELSNRHHVEQTSFNELKQQVELAQSRLVDLSGSSDWLLAEANYLAFMANERLHTAQDVTTALAQLSAADERLATMGNPALLWVRQAIAKDLAKLHSFPIVNRQEIWEQLGLLSTEINQLHFKRLSNELINENEKTIPEEGFTNGWKKALLISWQELKGLIRVTRLADNAIPQALTDQEQAQILRTMQLYCEQARWAILQGDTKVYQNSLEALKTWISQYFMVDKISEQLSTQITQLQQQRADIAVPDISESLQALSKAMLQAQNKQPVTHQPQPMKGGVQ